MKKSIFVLLTVTLALCALFVSCNSEVTASQGDSKDLVSVSFDSGNSKGLSATIEPFDKGSYYWKYAARKNSADGTGLNSGATATYDEDGAVFIHEATKGLDGQVPGFSQGIWDFMLFAYKKVGSDYVLVFSGETPAVKLVKGGENKVLVTVSPSGTANGTLIIGETELTPASSADIPSVSRYVKVVKVDETTERTPVSGTEYSLEPGAYQVTVEFKANDIVYASDLVVATVYPGVTTLVTGNIDELTTYAVFDADANIIDDTVTSTPSSYDVEKEESTTTVDFSSSSVTTKVTASTTERVLQKYMKAVNATASNQETSLALKVETETATETTVSYEISMDAIIKTTTGTVVNTNTQDVKDLGANNYVTIILELQPGLEAVSVKHSNATMAAGNGPQDDDSSRHGVYKYDAATGKLTIWTTTFSPFAVSFTVPVETYGVAQIGTTKYRTLEEAFNAANSGDTIKLLSNTEGAGLFLPKDLNKDIVLDMNGHTYTCTGPAVGSTGTQSQALHLEKNNTVTVKNGTITSTPDSGVKMLVQNYSNLTLDSVVLDGSNLGSGQYVGSNNCGTVKIKGSSSVIVPENGVAFDAYFWPKNGYSAGVSVEIDTTGTIGGVIELDADGTYETYGNSITIKNGVFTGSLNVVKGSLVISGGVFSYNPSTYVPAGYSVTENPDGSWTVDKLYDVKISKADESDVFMNLTDFRSAVNAGNNFNGYTVTLLRDIDLDGAEWVPIGNSQYSFSGMFDGNNKKISNFKVTEGTAVGSRTYLGFFTTIKALDGKTAGVKNLTISDAMYGDEGSSKPLGVICVYSTSDDVEESTILFQNITIDDVIVCNIGGWGNTGLAAVAAANHTVISGCDISIDFIIPAFAKQPEDYKFISPCIGQISADNSGNNATITFENNDVVGCTYSYDSSDLEAHGNNGTGHQTVWLYHKITQNNTITAIAKMFGQIYKTGMTLIIDGDVIPYDADHFFNPTSTSGCQMKIDRIIYTELKPLVMSEVN